MGAGKVVDIKAYTISAALKVARIRNPNYVPIGGHQTKDPSRLKTFRIRMRPRKRK